MKKIFLSDAMLKIPGENSYYIRNYSVHNLLCAYEKANERKDCLNKTLRFPHTTHTVFLWKSGGFLI